MKPLHHTYAMKQAVKLLANQFGIYSVTDGAETLVAKAKQKMMRIREEIVFNEGDSDTPYFVVKAEKAIDIHGKYIISDANGTSLGYARKAFQKSLIRSTWELYGADDALLCTVTERSMAFAVVRRIWDIIPILGEFPLIRRLHFDYMIGDEVVGSFERRWGLRDHYDATFTDQARQILDERVALASMVMLDAMQSR